MTAQRYALAEDGIRPCDDGGYVLITDYDALYAAIQKAQDCIDFPRENDAIVALCDIEKILKAAMVAARTRNCASGGPA